MAPKAAHIYAVGMLCSSATCGVLLLYTCTSIYNPMHMHVYTYVHELIHGLGPNKHHWTAMYFELATCTMYMCMCMYIYMYVALGNMHDLSGSHLYIVHVTILYMHINLHTMFCAWRCCPHSSECLVIFPPTTSISLRTGINLLYIIQTHDICIKIHVKMYMYKQKTFMGPEEL